MKMTCLFFKKFMTVVWVICSSVPVFGQVPELTAHKYRQCVLDYSRQIHQNNAQAEAMAEAVKVARTAFFPGIDFAGNYQYRINKYSMALGPASVEMDPNTYALEAGVSQPVYAGGQIYNSYKAAKIQSKIAEMAVTLTTDNIIRAADVSYWSAAANKRLYEIMCEYVDIVGELAQVLTIRFEDGQISKTDLLQVQSRLKEAELSKSDSYKNYQLSLQALNTLMGIAPLEPVHVADSISLYLSLPLKAGDDSYLENRPDYRIALLDIDYQQRQINLAKARYNPSLAIGFKESWGTQMLNVKGSDKMWNSMLYASLQIPLFHWGARFKEINMQKSLLVSKQYAAEATRDQISQEVANAWTSLQQYTKQIDVAWQGCQIAVENLELNTFSYNEGKLPILDVLSAQLSWIQAYSSLIQVQLQQKVSLADYNKAIGNR